jgi:hypothetical protein
MAFPGDITSDSSPILIGWAHLDNFLFFRFVPVIEFRENAREGLGEISQN